MSVRSPSGTSNEVSVEVHSVPGEKSHKRPKNSTDKDGKDSRHDDMGSAQLSALQKTLEEGFSHMTESLATILSQTFEKYVVEEEVEVPEGDANDSNLSNSSKHELRREATAKQPSPAGHMDVDTTVNDLLTNDKEQGTEKQPNGASRVGDFLARVKNDLKSEETGPPFHEELAKIGTRLVLDDMLEDKLQEKLNKYPQPENCEGLTKVRANQLIWNNLSPSVRSQDLRFKKVQTSIVKGMTALARVADAILKNVNEINGGKVLAQEAIDSLSLFTHANAELNTRRKELIKPGLHSDYKHLCSASIPVTAELFGDYLSKQVKDISEVNRVCRRVTYTTMSHHRGHSYTHFGYKSQSSGGRGKYFRVRGQKKHFFAPASGCKSRSCHSEFRRPQAKGSEEVNPDSADLPEVSSNNFGVESFLKPEGRLKYFLPEWRGLTYLTHRFLKQLKVLFLMLSLFTVPLHQCFLQRKFHLIRKKHALLIHS